MAIIAEPTSRNLLMLSKIEIGNYYIISLKFVKKTRHSVFWCLGDQCSCWTKLFLVGNLRLQKPHGIAINPPIHDAVEQGKWNAILVCIKLHVCTKSF